MQPCFDQVLIRRDRPKEMEGDIHLPEAARKEVNTGEIVAVGPSVPPDCPLPSTRVMWPRYGGFVFRQNDDDFVVLPAKLLRLTL